MISASPLLFVGLSFDFRGRGVVKVCAIWLWLEGEQMFLNGHVGYLCLLFNVKS